MVVAEEGRLTKEIMVGIYLKVSPQMYDSAVHAHYARVVYSKCLNLLLRFSTFQIYEFRHQS